MEYLIIIILEFCGVAFSMGTKIAELNKNTTEEDTISHILHTYVRRDFVTIFLSGIVIIMNIVFHYVMELFGTGLATRVFGDLNTYKVFSFALAFFLGWGGQAFFYKLLGKTEQYLHKRVDEKLGG